MSARLIPETQDDGQQDAIWNGVEREIENVSLLDLAESICFGNKADEDLSHGDKSQAIIDYDKSLEQFASWGHARQNRYFCSGPWEPEILTYTFQAEFGPEKGKKFSASLAPHFYKQLPGATQDIQIDYLRTGWRKYTSGISVSKWRGASKVDFESGKKEWAVDPGTISHSLADQALQFTAEPAAEKATPFGTQ